ncbi:MAG: molybdenum cofactor guanylyltransferase [Clostridia bacterium]|nr:molybdenum cofactor guanylyltransferase [Clostridia bacterium]
MKAMGIGILCGGRGSRMGGVDKGALRLNGQTFLARISALAEDFDERLISGTPDVLPQGFRAWPDDVPGCGPMGGICTLLRHCESAALLIVACDMPLMSRAAMSALRRAWFPGLAACALETAPGQLEPLAAIYGREACLPAMNRALAEGRWRLRGLLREVGAKPVPFADTSATFNVNTPEEYDALLRGRPETDFFQ